MRTESAVMPATSKVKAEDSPVTRRRLLRAPAHSAGCPTRLGTSGRFLPLWCGLPSTLIKVGPYHVVATPRPPSTRSSAHRVGAQHSAHAPGHARRGRARFGAVVNHEAVSIHGQVFSWTCFHFSWKDNSEWNRGAIW